MYAENIEKRYQVYIDNFYKPSTDKYVKKNRRSRFIKKIFIKKIQKTYKIMYN